MRFRYSSIFAIVLVLLSGISVLLDGSITNNADAKYANTKTQSQANTNDCDTGTNCSVTSPQTQGDGGASAPINLQISKFNENGKDQEGDPQDRITSTFDLEIIVICPPTLPSGVTCPKVNELQFAQGIEAVNPLVSISPEVFSPDATGHQQLFVTIPRNGGTVVFSINLLAPLEPPGLLLDQITTPSEPFCSEQNTQSVIGAIPGVEMHVDCLLEVHYEIFTP